MFHIFPAIDLRAGRCVRLEQGDYGRQTTYDAQPTAVARRWQDAGAPLIHVVDLDGAKDGAPANLETVAAVCAAVAIPCELGGGIRDLATAERALAAGVARVILGTSAAERPALAGDLVDTLGTEAIVAGIDARDGLVAVRGWREAGTVTALDLARQLADFGVGRFIFTDIATDGMFTGPNLPAVRAFCTAVPEARVIASGGVGEPAHVRQLVELGLPNLEGVIVGKALYDGRLDYAELLAARH